MTDCIDRDDLVSLTSIFGGSATVALEHLASCDRCLETVSQLETLHDAVTGVEPLGETVVESIMARIEEARREAMPEPPASPPSSLPVARKPRLTELLLPATGFAGLVFLVVVLLLTGAPRLASSPPATMSLTGVILPALLAAVAATRLVLTES